jgi:mannonate dehydratase
MIVAIVSLTQRLPPMQKKIFPWMQESFRWYGPQDTVTLADIRQCGATGVFTALHHIPYGEAWPLEDILQRKQELAAYELAWVAAEPVPVSEAIKSRSAGSERHLENYCETLRRLGQAGIHVVLNCFMPVLEWVRTDLTRRLPDGKICLSFDPCQFAAFERFILQRPGAKADYSEMEWKQAADFFGAMSPAEQQAFGERILGMLPGFHQAFSAAQLRERIELYAGIDETQLRRNLHAFLEAVVPVAEQAGVRLAMHPDDPPFSLLGLPRILSTESDFQTMLAMVDSPANGLGCCTGSLGPRADNDLPGMVRRLGSKIHAIHLRNVQREADRAFFEADHLRGSVDMPAVVEAILEEQGRRVATGREDVSIPMRPDHGHLMLDDLRKPPPKNPGYACIGRMRGLAELRGLQQGLAHAMTLHP